MMGCKWGSHGGRDSLWPGQRPGWDPWCPVGTVSSQPRRCRPMAELLMPPPGLPGSAYPTALAWGSPARGMPRAAQLPAAQRGSAQTDSLPPTQVPHPGTLAPTHQLAQHPPSHPWHLFSTLLSPPQSWGLGVSGGQGVLADCGDGGTGSRAPCPRSRLGWPVGEEETVVGARLHSPGCVLV
ncbi:unnamed protein product [Caretta caretta]